MQLPLVAIVGPTASGKSALAVCLAAQFRGDVVACDSTQLYKGFDIGTAKASREERSAVTHHLLDVLKPQEEATAGGYRERALAVLEILRESRRVPFFTVGTGLYLRALLEGLADVPQRDEPLRERLRESAEAHPPGYLHGLLLRLDPQAASKIAAADSQKLIRAIEVCLLAKKPISEVHRSGRVALQGWKILKIGLMPPRENLYARIHARTESMLQTGWLDEVRGLLDSGLPETAKPFDFIGYRELREVARGSLSLDAAREAIEQATRRYAKRQLTWFRKDAAIHWLTGFGDEVSMQREAARHLAGQGLAEVRGASVPSV